MEAALPFRTPTEQTNGGLGMADIVDEASLAREHFAFLRPPADDKPVPDEERLARELESSLLKDAAIVDLSRVKHGKVGMRWRTVPEAMEGKGRTICGGVGCGEKRMLRELELPFGWQESTDSTVPRVALVTARLCPKCALEVCRARRVIAKGVD
jgi:protein FRA10AC1